MKTAISRPCQLHLVIDLLPIRERLINHWTASSPSGGRTVTPQIARLVVEWERITYWEKHHSRKYFNNRVVAIIAAWISPGRGSNSIGGHWRQIFCWMTAAASVWRHLEKVLRQVCQSIMLQGLPSIILRWQGNVLLNTLNSMEHGVTCKLHN